MTQRENVSPSSNQPDYSVLDRPEMLSAAFYPRREWTETPPGAHDYLIPVEERVSISSRFYPATTEDSPIILYFHGNGEVACNYDNIAMTYNRLGMSLFVADYRGYGRSGGVPVFSSMTSDANAIFEFFKKIVQTNNPEPRMFVMGRSLGCISALDVAFCHKEQLSGLIVESGVGNIAEAADIFGFYSETLNELAEEISDRISSIEIPALVIHGELDNLIPVEVGIKLHHELGSRQKKLLIVPHAEHNNIILVGSGAYFSAILDFVSADREAELDSK